MNDDRDGAHIKETYAHFGLAHYLAQVLEHGVVNALVYLELIPSKIHTKQQRSREEWLQYFDEFMDRKFEATLGRLIKGLREHDVVTDELEAALVPALRARNWLSHGYFRDRASEFMTEVGRESMISELQEFQNLFEKADTLLESALKPTRLKYGFTEEKLEKAVSEALQQVGVANRGTLQ